VRDIDRHDLRRVYAQKIAREDALRYTTTLRREDGKMLMFDDFTLTRGGI